VGLEDEIARAVPVCRLGSQVPGLILTLLISVALLGIFLYDRRITRKQSDEKAAERVNEV